MDGVMESTIFWIVFGVGAVALTGFCLAVALRPRKDDTSSSRHYGVEEEMW